MKKVLSVILAIVTILSNLSVLSFAKEAKVDDDLGKEIILCYLENAGCSSLSAVYGEYVYTSDFTKSAIKFGLDIGSSSSKAIQYLKDSDAYNNKLDLKYTDAANAVFLKAFGEAEVDFASIESIGLDFISELGSVSSSVNKLSKIDYDSLFAGLNNNYNSADTKYIKKALDEVFPKLKTIYPNLNKSGTLEKIYKKVGDINILKAISKFADITDFLYKFMVHIETYEANLEKINSLLEIVDHNSTLGKGLIRMKGQYDDGILDFFSSPQCVEKIENLISGEIIKAISVGSYGSLVTTTMSVVNVANKIIFDSILKTPDVSTAYTYNILQMYVADYSDILLDKVQPLVASQNYTDFDLLVDISTQSITYFTLFNSVLEYGKQIAKYNDEYDVSFINGEIEKNNKCIEKFIDYLEELASLKKDSTETKKVPAVMTVSASKSNYTTNDNVVLNWTSSLNATEYGLTVKRVEDGKTIFNSRLNGSSKNLGCLEAGTYTYVMRGHNANGKGPLTPVKYFTVTNKASDATTRIEELKKIFPSGSYFSADGKACNHTSSDTCSNCNLVNVLKREDLKDYRFSDSGSWTCLAFAKFAWYFIHGKTWTGSYDVVIDKGNFNEDFFSQAVPGDMIYFFNSSGKFRHAAIFCGDATDKSAVFYHANTGGSPNKVGYGSWNYSSMASHYGSGSYARLLRIKDYTPKNVVFNEITDGKYRLSNAGYFVNVLNDVQGTSSLNTSMSSNCTFLISKENEYYKFTSENSSSSFVLNVWTTGKSVSGSEVTLYKNTGNPSQRWCFEKCEDGYLIHPADNTSLSLTRNTLTNKLYVNTTTKNNNQIWTLEKVNDCTITYNANGGIEPPSPQTVTKGEYITISNEKLSRSGYEFLGWSKSSSSSKADYTPGQKVTINEDITLYAVWKAKDESFVLTIGDTKANVFGQIKYNDVAPIIENNRTMLPARFIAENLGADVEWIDSSRCVLITKGNTKIEIFIGNEYAKVNGKKYKLDSPAFIRENRTYTPVRFICENLGADVEWNSKERSVKITLIKCSVCGSTNHTDHIESDGWEESLPSFVKNNQDDYIIEKRTEYLYETRETRESDKEYISGWDLYDSQMNSNSWSEWQETPVYESSTREVRTKTQYGYYHYALYFNKVDFGTYPVDLEFYNNTELSDALREEYHEVWLDSKLSESGNVTYYNKVTEQRVTKTGYKNIHCTPTKMNKLYFLGERTVYQYKNVTPTFYHEKWTRGEWTSKKMSENNNCRLVDTRTVYKYESR